MADRDLLGATLGPYIVRELIREGGYGAVYRAEEPALERDVVVKVLHERRNDSDSRERFLREAKLAAQLDHPYAAHVYAFGAEDDGRLLWIAMERVRGVPLDVWLDRHGPMSPEQFGPFFEGLCEVVHFAHKQGIIHRDLKPSNIMVVECEGRPLPKLLDFGIAKWHRHPQVAPDPGSDEDLDPDHAALKTDRLPVRPRRARRTGGCHDSDSRRQLTPPGECLGSPAYMALEQWVGADAVGSEADIYALGIIACEMLTGRRLFVANRTADYFDQHIRASALRLGDGFPPALDLVIQCALDKDPRARPATALELASELRRALRQIKREQLRAAAQQWFDQDAAPGLLWGADVLEETLRSVPQETLSPLECSFVAASQRRILHAHRIRRSLVSLAAVSVLAAVAFYLVLRADTAEKLARQAEVEEGRQALLHGESSEAVRHLETAYQRGDHSPEVAFMLARALQPRMSELARFTSSSGRVWSAMFTPDGKRVLTTDDKSARMWDAVSGQLLFTMSHGDTVYRAIFSPDGSRIITAGGDGSVRIWNAATGAPIRKLTSPPSGTKQWRYSMVAVSSHLVAAIDMIGRVAHVWDAETGTQIVELTELANDASEKASLAFSPDGQWLATTGGDDVQVFDTSTWRRAVTIAGPRVRSLSFDPTGPRLAVGTYDGVASIWEIPSGVRVRYLRDAGSSVDVVAFSRDGVLIAAGSRDGTEQVWDAASGGLRTEFNSHHDKIYAVEFSPSGDLMLSAGADGAVVTSNVATGMPVARLEGPKSLVIAAHFDPESHRVVGASWDGTARVWDAASPYRRWDSPQIGAECDTEESLVPDQRFIALSCRNHGTHIWDTGRDMLLAELPGVTTVEGNYSSALPALTATGDRAAIARGNTVEVYALPSAQLLRAIALPAAVNAVAFAPAGHDLICGAVDGSLRITHDEGEPIALPTAPAGIDAVAILPDGRVVVADAGARLRVISPDDNALLMNVAAPSRVRLLRPSPDGARVITISTTREQAPPVLWDLDQHRLVAHLDGHVGRVFTARFVGGGHEILTAGADGTARLWDAATGSPRQSFRGDSHFLVDATLAPDGSVVVAGGSDGFLRFWDRSNGRLLWKLQAHRSYVIGVHYEGNDLVTRGFAGDVARWALPPPGRVIEACQATTCASAVTAGK